jgi:hypothetical protein
VRNWVRGIALAIVFALVGAFSASLWLEIRREAQLSVGPDLGYWEGRRIRVEVLNGAGADRLAQRATRRLRDRGFDVVYYGNADAFGRDTSMAIARVDSIEPARRVADALGLRNVALRPDRNLYLDVTVILGTDWVAREATPTEPPPTGLRLWWNRSRRALRRLWPG